MDGTNTPPGLWEAVAGTVGEVDALYEFAPVGLCLMDTDLRFLRINRRLADINGLSIDAHLGRTVEEVVPSLAPLAREICARIVATGAPVQNVEFAGETAAAPGEQHVWREQWWPIKDRLGRVAAIYVAVEDVTAERQLADALRAADRIKDDFLSSVSHDLRGPLNVIRGWMHMLRFGSVEPDRYADIFERVDRAAKTQQRLVEDLLDLTRISTGKLTMRYETVRLEPVIAMACDGVRELLDAKPVQLSVTIEGSGVAWGDSARVQQIVTNLVENAVKFTTVGQVVIGVHDVEQFVELTIRDTGDGFERSELEQMFARFGQAGTPRSPSTGVGLGLFIVRRLVHLHGGTIKAHSPGPGLGATFTVTLPRMAP